MPQATFRARRRFYHVFSLTCAFAAASAGSLQAADRVDFSCAPPEWQTAICLPDDPHKSLVDKSGELLYHFNKGGREFGTRIRIEVSDDAVWQKQELHSPRVPIVKTYRSARGLNILEQAFAVNAPARSDCVLVRVTNTGSESRTLQPKLVVDTKLGLELKDQRIVINKGETITTSLKITGLAQENQVQLAPLAVPAGQTAEFSIQYSPGEAVANPPATIEQAVKYWQNAPLPFDRVTVPDAGIQALLDSSIRNIWQAREIKNGLPAFQVGPTCYRGLWIVDGAFLLEAAALLGAGEQARNGVAYELTYQQADGRIEVMKNFSKENGIVLWTCVRHAQLTQDKAWLESVWPKLLRVAEHLKRLRQETLQNDTPLDDGLVSAGFSDGGIGGINCEYTNPYWNLVGLHSFVAAARWLGKKDTAALWQREYDDFFAAFRKAAARDQRKDAHGNSFLPILMGEAGAKELPQRGQWGFCHAVYPGQIFAKDDPLVAGNLAMLAATEREGMVYGTGWDATGLWNYFASFYGHAWLWQGDGRKAAQVLYAFANHAAPVLDWREEQSLQGEKYKKVGDMPHNWASAEFIRLTIHLLALDRGAELHLLEGLPLGWTQRGMVTRLAGIATPFGPLNLELKIAADGTTAHLHIEPLREASCKKVVVHLAGWARTGQPAVLKLNPRKVCDRTIPL